MKPKCFDVIVCVTSLCICMYMCNYVCVIVYNIYMYVCMHVCIYVCVYICVLVYAYVYMCVCIVYICNCVCMCVYMCMCGCLCMCPYVTQPKNSLFWEKDERVGDFNKTLIWCGHILYYTVTHFYFTSLLLRRLL